MSKLDDIKPSHGSEYDVELLVEGEWVIKSLMTKQQILKLSDYFDTIMEEE